VPTYYAKKRKYEKIGYELYPKEKEEYASLVFYRIKTVTNPAYLKYGFIRNIARNCIYNIEREKGKNVIAEEKKTRVSGVYVYSGTVNAKSKKGKNGKKIYSIFFTKSYLVLALLSVDDVDNAKYNYESDYFDHVIGELKVPARNRVKQASLGERNALEKAKEYLDFSPFSMKGLYDQLKFENFSDKEATYAVTNCGANWKKQAYLKAKDYLDFSSFSRQGLIEQLEFDGFTSEEAQYAVKKVGY
jgi:hypothetical protein